MTTRSYTDGDEIPAQPAVRSAWDAVKGDILGIAAFSAGAGVNAVDIAINSLHGGGSGLVGTGFSIVGGVLCGLMVAANVASAANKLKQVIAPPQP